MTLLNISVSNEVVLSPSRVEGGQRCLRKHALAEICGVKPNNHEQPALDFGEAMHRGVGCWWLTKDIIAAKQIIENACEWPLNTTHTLALAYRLMDVYVTEARLMPYGSEDDWIIETAEKREYLEIAGATLGFQIDRLLRNVHTNALALVDLKTASRCDKRWEVRWPRSIQMKLYAECIAQKYGQPLMWLIIEGLEKTKAGVHYLTLPDVSEAKRAEAVRSYLWVARHDHQLLEGCKDADGVVMVDKLVERALIETPFSEAECFSYHSECDYLPLCDAEPDQRVALLQEGYHYEAPKHLV